jgi:Ca2+-transporting ATPase
MDMDDATLSEAVKKTALFARMFPEAKLRVINALKANGEIVAMTGDGVNDGPALKAAHIGIAMGKKGSEIAKEAASLVLINDNFTAMVKAVAIGRRIYINLKKAILYIISIHIPIITTVILPLALNLKYPTLLMPIHIIFLELIMGPTCSIIYENEPMEKNVMLQKPRPITNTFFAWRELAASIMQGLVISAGVLGIYQYAVHLGEAESTTRSLVFLTLVSANVFLTFINRSIFDSLWVSFQRKNNLVYLITGITVVLTTVIFLVPFIARIFQLAPLPWPQAAMAIGTGAAATLWFEGVKLWRRRKRN